MKRRRRERVGTEPQRNDRRGTAGGKAADHSALKNGARDERVFLRNGTGGCEGFGRTADGEVEQESALVTAEPNLFSNNASGFVHKRMLKGTGIGVERGRLEA